MHDDYRYQLDLSFIIPALNEAESLPLLTEKIAAECDRLGHSFEIIIVDDGSSDNSWDVVRGLANDQKTIRGISLRSNFGKGPALMAGIDHANGRIIFFMDADLQDDPSNIERFLDKLKQGQDVVVGWRKQRQDSLSKRMQSKLFNSTVSTFTGLKLHDHNCGFKCFVADVFDNMTIYGDMHRFLPIMAHMNGYKCAEVEVEHFPRKFGVSKYGWGRTYRGMFDLVTILFLSYRQRPMHLLGVLGFIAVAFGLGGLAYLAALWLTGQGIGQRPLLIYSAASLLLGAQLFATGVIAELITSFHMKNERLYSIRGFIGPRHLLGATSQSRGVTAAGAAARQAQGSSDAVPPDNGFVDFDIHRH